MGPPSEQPRLQLRLPTNSCAWKCFLMARPADLPASVLLRRPLGGEWKLLRVGAVVLSSGADGHSARGSLGHPASALLPSFTLASSMIVWPWLQRVSTTLSSTAWCADIFLRLSSAWTCSSNARFLARPAPHPPASNIFQNDPAL